MNYLDFGCPHCNQPFRVDALDAGRVVECPSCAHPVEVPADSSDDSSRAPLPSHAPEIGRKPKAKSPPPMPPSQSKFPSVKPGGSGSKPRTDPPAVADTPIQPIRRTLRRTSDQKLDPTIASPEKKTNRDPVEPVVPEVLATDEGETDNGLPPRFDVFDPKRAGINQSRNEHRVILPDGHGGIAQVDNRVLRVKDGEREVSLIAMSPEQRSRRRLIQNIIAILIGIAVMAIAFSLLR